jgi:hypothetical protein
MYKQKLAIFVLVGGARSGATRAVARRADSKPDVLGRRRSGTRQARTIRGGTQSPSTGARPALERISRTLESNRGADARTIRVRAGFLRERGDAGEAVLARLLRDGFVERRPVNADWRTRRKDR